MILIKTCQSEQVNRFFQHFYNMQNAVWTIFKQPNFKFSEGVGNWKRAKSGKKLTAFPVRFIWWAKMKKKMSIVLF